MPMKGFAQFAPLQEATMDSLIQLGQSLAAQVEKVSRLQLDAGLASSRDAMAATQALFEVKDADGLAKWQADYLQPNFDRAADSARQQYALLLETRGKATVRLDSSRNVYQAWGSELDHPLGQWVVETTTRELGLNKHVAFIHDKFLLSDPLGPDPVVVTGSANFSKASTTENDENMIIIRGDARVADIYFTEFNRLFFHYYFRSVVQQLSARNGQQQGDQPQADQHAFDLIENDTWTLKYAPGTLRAKRVQKLAEMADPLDG